MSHYWKHGETGLELITDAAGWEKYWDGCKTAHITKWITDNYYLDQGTPCFSCLIMELWFKAYCRKRLSKENGLID